MPGVGMAGRVLVVIFLALLLTPLISYNAFAQHGHEPSPATVGDRKLTVSLHIDSVVADSREYLGHIKLINDDTRATILHVTYFVTIAKDGTKLMQEWFHDHEGDLPFKIRPKDASKVTVFGEKEPTLNAYMKRGSDPVIIEGPLLMTDGVYDFKIEIFSIDNDKTLLDQPIKYEIQVPIGEQNGMRLHGSKTVAGLHVELLTDQNKFEPNIATKFWLKIRDAREGESIEKVPHEFVIMSNDKEIFREYHDSPSYIHEYTFTEEETGPVTIKIENLNNSGEDLEFGLTVVPEFPLGAILAMTGVIGAMVLVTRIRKIRTLIEY